MHSLLEITYEYYLIILISFYYDIDLFFKMLSWIILHVYYLRSGLPKNTLKDAIQATTRIRSRGILKNSVTRQTSIDSRYHDRT